jgi:creatinine amidohydrolase
MMVTIPATERGPKLLEEMTTAEVADVLQVSDVAILAAAAIEQHGPHLPLGTDYFIAEEQTRRTLARLAEAGHRAVGYVFPVGISHKFLAFPGSITLSPLTLAQVLKEICQCLRDQGFRRFVLLSGNGGNGDAMKVAAEEIVHGLGVQAIFVDPLPNQFANRDQFLKNPAIEHHAAEGETSKILRVRPELVQLARARYIPLDAAARRRTQFGHGVVRAGGDWRAFAPEGYVGDPTLAEASTGDRVFELNAAWIASAVTAEYFA